MAPIVRSRAALTGGEKASEGAAGATPKPCAALIASPKPRTQRNSKKAASSATSTNATELRGSSAPGGDVLDAEAPDREDPDDEAAAGPAVSIAVPGLDAARVASRDG